MSFKNKLNWLMLVVWALLTIMMFWLILGGSKPSNGLECVYNCSDYETMLESLKTSYNDEIDLVGSVPLQATKQVQKTQSSAMLHELSIGVEMRPLEMLRSGRLVK